MHNRINGCGLLAYPSVWLSSRSRGASSRYEIWETSKKRHRKFINISLSLFQTHGKLFQRQEYECSCWMTPPTHADQPVANTTVVEQSVAKYVCIHIKCVMPYQSYASSTPWFGDFNVWFETLCLYVVNLQPSVALATTRWVYIHKVKQQKLKY